METQATITHRSKLRPLQVQQSDMKRLYSKQDREPSAAGAWLFHAGHSDDAHLACLVHTHVYMPQFGWVRLQECLPDPVQPRSVRVWRDRAWWIEIEWEPHAGPPSGAAPVVDDEVQETMRRLERIVRRMHRSIRRSLKQTNALPSNRRQKKEERLARHTRRVGGPAASRHPTHECGHRSLRIRKLKLCGPQGMMQGAGDASTAVWAMESQLGGTPA